MTSEENRRMGRTPEANKRGWLTGSGALAGLLGMLASSCCVLPIVMLNLGIAGTAAVLIPWLATWRLPVLLAGGLLLAAGWYSHWCAPRACGSACGAVASRAGPIGLSLASAVWLLALSWSTWVEPVLLRWVR
jgi:mercuric ion transport protein